MSELTDRIEKCKQVILHNPTADMVEPLLTLTACQSEIERLERENAQLKESQAKQFDDSYKLTVEKQRLERQLELLTLHRRFHGKVGCSGLRGCYVCEAEEAQSQKGSK